MAISSLIKASSKKEARNKKAKKEETNKSACK
jgi:hypothetical protein